MRVFVTGASGLLGGALAGALLDVGHRVVALVRSNRSIIDMDGRDRADEVQLVQGDVSLPNLGIEQQLGQIDMLAHCAATTDFAAPEKDYEQINIGGTVFALGCARAWRCSFLQVSTAYVCGTQDGVIAEEHVGEHGSYTNGYEASKAAAERLVMLAQRDGVPAAIARPSIIVGRYEDGAIPKMDNFYNMFRLMGDGELGQVPATSDATFNFVPIDHVVDGMLEMISDFDRFDGQAVHLTAPKSVELIKLIEAIGSYAGANPPEVVAPDQLSLDALTRRQRLIHRKVGENYYEYFSRRPEFRSEVLKQNAGLSCPDVDDAAMRRMIDFCVETGFLDWNEAAAEQCATT